MSIVRLFSAGGRRRYIMDQRFEGEVLQDLAADTPAAFSEEAYDSAEGTEEDDFASDDTMDAMDVYDDSGDAALSLEDDGFETDLGEDFEELDAADGMDAWEALEEAVADALDAEDTDEF